ncbi:MAG: Omp28-related outer membrane protein, partial [Clostridia bacterium]|nr:Omp28-related outer membrane protein [Clostridia bacterium]
DLSMAYNITGLYPMLTFNLTTASVGTDISEIKEQIDALKKDKADVGVAAAASLSGDEVLVNVEIKAAKTNNYRVAAWLLADKVMSFVLGRKISIAR